MEERGSRRHFNFSSFNFKNKSGLSAIVATLLIILLVLVAIGVIWAVISSVLRGGSDQIALEQKCLDVRFRTVGVANAGEGIYAVTLARTATGDPIQGVKINFFNSGGDTSGVLEFGAGMNALESKTRNVDTSLGDQVLGANEFEITPYFVDDLGKEENCPQTFAYDIGESITTVLGAGQGESGTGVCGDGLIQTPNGDGVNEDCDGNEFGIETCITLGFESGTLSCQTSCTFDSSECTITPSSCDGVWNAGSEDEGVECDGGSSCEPLTCTCPPGFTADEAGACDLNAPTHTGTVDSFFTSDNPFQFTSSDLPNPAIESVIASHINFTGFAGSCRQITYHAEIPPDTGAYYVRLNDSVSGLANTTQFSIYEADNCGIIA